MKFVIIGTGFGAITHLPALLAIDGVQVAALCNTGSNKIIATVDNNISIQSDWREAIRIPDIDAVSIVTPPGLHREIVQESLDLGLHVLCEKPFGLNAEDARAMHEKQKLMKIACAVGFQFRFEPGILELWKMVTSGDIGKIQTLNIAWLTSGRADRDIPWSWQNDAASGGGVINSFLSHLVDILNWITDTECLSVQSNTQILIGKRPDKDGNERQVTAEDKVEACFKFANKIEATVVVSNCHPDGPGMEITVTGDAGQIVYRHRPPFRPRDANLEIEVAGNARKILPLSVSSDQDSRIFSVRALNQCFMNSIRGEETPNLPVFEDGLRVQIILDAVRESRIQGLPVELKSIPTLNS